MTIENDYEKYIDTIANGIKSNGREHDFLVHVSTHASEIITQALKEGSIDRKKLIAMRNLVNIADAVHDGDKITTKECLDALHVHHEKTKNWSIDADGKIKTDEPAR